MKKLLVVSILSLCFVVSKTQSVTSKAPMYATAVSFRDTTPGMSNGSMNDNMMAKDGMMMMKDGKMMVMKDGKWMMMKKTMMCSDGCKVMTNGEVIMKDGKKMMMTNGMMIDANGHMMDANGKMMMMDSTKMMNKM